MSARIPGLVRTPLLLLALLVPAPGHGATHSPAPRHGTPADEPGGLSSPYALALWGDRLFVADFDGDRIQVYARDGGFLYGWGRAGSGGGEFRGPAGIAIDAGGTVYVTDLYNSRVQKFTADGRHLGGWPAGAAPCGIAVDNRGRVYVTDLEAGCVRSWSRDGSPRTAFGTLGRAPGQLIEPWGIAVDALGGVLVADHGNHRVQRFTSDGVCVGHWGEPGTGPAQLLGPMGLAVDQEGVLYVTDLSGDRVRCFTRDGDLVATRRAAAGGNALARPVPALALDADKGIFLADPSRHGIFRIAGDAQSVSSPAPADFVLTRIAHTPGPGPVTLHLAIPAPGLVGAAIFSLDGGRICTIPASSCGPGEHRIVWDARTQDGRPAPAGMYFVRVRFEDGVRRLVRTGRIVVFR